MGLWCFGMHTERQMPKTPITHWIEAPEGTLTYTPSGGICGVWVKRQEGTSISTAEVASSLEVEEQVVENEEVVSRPKSQVDWQSNTMFFSGFGSDPGQLVTLNWRWKGPLPKPHTLGIFVETFSASDGRAMLWGINKLAEILACASILLATTIAIVSRKKRPVPTAKTAANM